MNNIETILQWTHEYDEMRLDWIEFFFFAFCLWVRRVYGEAIASEIKEERERKWERRTHTWKPFHAHNNAIRTSTWIPNAFDTSDTMNV